MWEQNWVWLLYCFHFERNYDVLKSKSPCILLNKIINFNKNETESKMENPTHSLERQTLCFDSYKNRKLKVKLWWIGALEIKKGIFCIVYFVRRGCFFEDICFISLYSILNTLYTYFYIKKTLLHILHILLLLVFKSSKAFSVSRNSHQRCSIKIGVVRNFAKFTGKHRVSFSIKLQASGLQLYTKRLCHRCFLQILRHL